jgi:hypothetical protein
MRGFVTRKKDGNHDEVRNALTAAGAAVYDAADDGSPFDLIVFWRGVTTLVEVKDGSKPPSARKLTPASVQIKNLAASRGCTIELVRSVEEALFLIGAVVSA